MSLRRRLTVAGGGAVFVALAIASLVIYFDVRSNLHDQIDVSLFQSAQAVALKWGAAQEAQPAGGKGAGFASVWEGRPRPASSRLGSPRRLTGRSSAATRPAISR